MPASAMLNNVVIVVVDDDDSFRLTLREFLIRKGATVVACPDAIQGLEAVRAYHPNIVLSDISLPNRDGFELLQDIRSLGPEQNGEVPVIAMTALEGVADFGLTIDNGFQANLHKPFRPDQLLAAVRSTLGNLS
ncbi:MAG TPA: response regulator [Chthoniobacterales bacterium]|nr:response regulator [Chthoniobacterales bacterium]